MSLWFGGSFSTGGVIGKIRRSRLGLIGYRYSHRLIPVASEAPDSSPKVTYMADLFPAVFLSIPAEAVPSLVTPYQDQRAEPRPQNRELNTYGLGASPIGLRINFRPTSRLQPFIGGSTGFVYFLRSVPNEQGKQLNFTADAGGGLQVILSPSVALLIGYRYHHLSNGFRGQINPGVDANLLYLGVSVSP